MLEGRVGFGPTTSRLKVGGSTTELTAPETLRAVRQGGEAELAIRPVRPVDSSLPTACTATRPAPDPGASHRPGPRLA